MLLGALDGARAQSQAPTPMAAASPPATGLRVAPSLSITAMPSYGVAPLTVGFFVSAADPEQLGFVSYHWNFGDGQVAVSPPLMTYNVYKKPGNYLVTLTALTADGRSITAFVGITVRPQGLGPD